MIPILSIYPNLYLYSFLLVSANSSCDGDAEEAFVGECRIDLSPAKPLAASFHQKRLNQNHFNEIKEATAATDGYDPLPQFRPT